ncbi:hypothetical protein PK98_05165 [Croceibacterium mercuriale]|uniref:Uncharacterized protein n=1 Tax=Croceibacterium mercuriale TaxID=1572751 RepID=A0A0B2BWZ8_9SPHN|nr:hypothetical protein [Croceibacterium mercuriale]KHL25959.1 hypothetical protein PK98_05165 [Croceibacterium mercuriale]
MADERIVTTETPEGASHTHTTIITEGPSRRSNGTALFGVIALLLIAAIAVWAFSTFGSAEAAKDNAIANAAGEVGEAAGQIGDAAKEAVN